MVTLDSLSCYIFTSILLIFGKLRSTHRSCWPATLLKTKPWHGVFFCEFCSLYEHLCYRSTYGRLLLQTEYLMVKYLLWNCHKIRYSKTTYEINFSLTNTLTAILFLCHVYLASLCTLWIMMHSLQRFNRDYI